MHAIINVVELDSKWSTVGDDLTVYTMCLSN